jgi:hypothetical protein
MAANTSPIFTLTPDIQWAISATTANTTKTLAAGTNFFCFSAGTNGSFVQRIRFRTLGTNVASVARIWINNGNTTATASNNTLWDEISLPATTVTETAAQSNYELPLNFALPPSYTIYVTLGTAVAAGWDVIVIGGDY